MTEQGGHAVGLNERLSRSRDKQAGLRWPVAVDDKLDRLHDAATAAAEITTRKEIVAALVATCELDGPALSDVVRKYRLMKVRDAMPAQPRSAKVVEFAHRKPGPRTARG